MTFQADAFQDDAFQTGIVSVVTPTTPTAKSDIKLPSLVGLGGAVDSLGNWTEAISHYLTALEKLEPQVEQFEIAYSPVTAEVRSVCMIPGSGEFVYEPATVTAREFQQRLDFDDNLKGTPFRPLNRNSNSGKTDVMASLDQLQARFPNIENIALVVSWFGTDLRAGECKIIPGVDDRRVIFKSDGFFSFGDGEYIPVLDTRPYQWSVAGIQRMDAYLTSTIPGQGNAYGGTPADRSVVSLIQEIKRRGLKVTFYPFILMDVPSGNTLPNPYGGSSQPVYPWRGRVTCYPAPGMPGTADRTAAARTQLNAFAARYRPMIMHYAKLCRDAGGVDAFLIGSEFRGLTWVRDETGAHPFVQSLISISNDVRAVVGNGTKIVYAADWSEFVPYQVPEGGVDFHLDPLWSSPNIDALGIDNYWPLSDWRGVFGIDEAKWSNIYDPAYLLANVEGGEGYDWYYASDSDRINQVRTPITDGLGKPWVFRYKDIRNWWLNKHYNRPNWVEQIEPTSWVPQSKPIWFTEIGCPAIDKGSNQPNVFFDPKSSESFFPYFSFGTRDDLIQARHIVALHLFYAMEEKNPKSTRYDGRMLDRHRMYVWCWDSRPFPEFPDLLEIWGDGGNWERGHWLTGRQTDFPPPGEPPPEGEILELMPHTPMPRGDRAVNPETGELEPAMHAYLAQIEKIAERLRNVQIIAIREQER